MTIEEKRSWHMSLMFLVASSSAFFSAGYRLSPGDGISIFGIGLAGSVLSFIAGVRFVGSPCVRIVTGFFQQACFVASAMMLAFACAQFNQPLADDTMLSFETILRYDWYGVVDVVANHAWLRAVLRLSYESLGYLMIVIIIAAGLNRDTRILPHFICANIVFLTIAMALFAAFPETTPWINAHLTPDHLARLHLRSSGGWPEQLLAVRHGAGMTISRNSAFAIVGFPSYHTGKGILLCWAAHRCGRIKWPIIAIVIPMIAATPYFGGHYLADILAAMVVSIVAIKAAEAFLSRGRAGSAAAVERNARAPRAAIV